jgi:uncharacterized protein (TIGR00106 family)
MMLVEFSIVPIGKGESVSPYVAECVLIVRESGLPHKLCPMGTLIEGEYEAVMDVVRRCHMRVMEMCSRAITTIKIDDRKGATDMLSQKVRSVEKRLDG